MNVKAEATAKVCPFLNKNQFCVVTKAGAGCRLEPYCVSVNHVQCGDYQKADNMDVQAEGHRYDNQSGSLGREKEKEITRQIIFVLEKNSLNVNQSRNILFETSKNILEMAHCLRVSNLELR